MVTELDGQLQDAIAKICAVDPARVSPDTRLVDVGVDSLAAAEVLVELEIRLGRELPANVLRGLDKAETVGDIAAQLRTCFGNTAPSAV